jgi:hypothetical protein
VIGKKKKNMARALIRQANNTIVGENLHLSLMVTYFGNGVPGGRDESLCLAVLNFGMTEAEAVTVQQDAILAEAQRLGYPLNRNSITSIYKLLAKV